MADSFILYDYFRSTASFRVRMALAYKKVDYELKEVHLVKDGGEQHTANYQDKNPFSLVPTLSHGEVNINQSMAIIEYLEDLYPQPELIAKEPILKAQIMSFCYNIVCDIHPLNNLRVLQYLQKDFALDDEQKMQWYFHWLTIGFKGIEKVLEKKAQTYCFGDQFTVADIVLVGQVYNAVRFKFDLTPFTMIQKIYDHCCTLDFVQQVHPDRSS